MPTSPRPFQSDSYLKNSSSKNLFFKSKNMKAERAYDEERINRLKDWITLYRKRPDIFAEHYLGISLYPYQRYWLCLMADSVEFLGIASRASAKSWLAGLLLCIKCILFPGTVCSLNSSTKQQAGLIISEKIVSMMDKSPNLSREIKSWICNSNNYEVVFHNGSKIKVVLSGDGGRGFRSSVSCLEERRLIDEDVINGIIRPFLVQRQVPFKDKPEYRDNPELIEEPQEIQITSAYLTSYPWYADAKRILKKIVDGDYTRKAVIFDYRLSVFHNLKTKRQMEAEEQKLDRVSFLQEYCSVPFSSGLDAYYRTSMFKRDIKQAWRPITVDMVGKRNPYDIPRQKDELRVVSCDVALRRGSGNDLTVLTCARLIPTNRGYKTSVVYMESYSGKNAVKIALRGKQIMEQFGGDYFVLDTQSQGLAVYDMMTTVTQNEDFGGEFVPYTVMYHPSIPNDLYEDLRSRTIGVNAKECIYPIMGSPQLNSLIHVSFRDRLKKKLISFLVDEVVAEESMVRHGGKELNDMNDSVSRSYLLSPHVQISLLINESIALETIPSGGLIKLQEPSGSRKDRVMSCAYLNYFVSLLDLELLKQYDEPDDWETLSSYVMSM